MMTAIMKPEMMNGNEVNAGATETDVGGVDEMKQARARGDVRVSVCNNDDDYTTALCT